MKSKSLPLILVVSIFFLPRILAHCPLCTIGAGAAAGAAIWLGISKVVVALFIGAFAMSMGMWFARWADKKKRIIPFQKTVIILVVFLTTVLPLLPLFNTIGPLYISFIGNYGTTYAVNYAIATSLLGGLVVFVSPTLSKKITKLRKGKTVSFQGVIMTLLLLVIIGTIIQLII
ncbi:MAG: hypothetical protein NUV97_02120 [archaeon]|nr:hypothetical protein [archaeon]MCR4323747.1 hypothetical protein [Nanoarchaeota archaeon]